MDVLIFDLVGKCFVEWSRKVGLFLLYWYLLEFRLVSIFIVVCLYFNVFLVGR